MQATAARLPDGTPVVALIETAVGDNAREIARPAATLHVAFGSGDFCRDAGSPLTPCRWPSHDRSW